MALQWDDSIPAIRRAADGSRFLSLEQFSMSFHLGIHETPFQVNGIFVGSAGQRYPLHQCAYGQLLEGETFISLL